MGHLTSLVLRACPALLVSLGSWSRPSYADHPGAFWTLLYALNVNIFKWLSRQQLKNSLCDTNVI